MTSPRLGDFLRRVAGSAGRFTTTSDRDVLGRFVADRDEAAFAELVRRHGGMVLAACRRTLGNTPDAEDACQATFLVLARKAASVRRTDAVGAWLYCVARRAAGRLRSRTARNQEVPLVDLPGPDTTADVTWRDGLRVLDEELSRLPEAYRAPLVLCYLEGKTQDEAARQLGWTLGAFRGRLERGRARLRDRLTRRGVGIAVLAGVATAQPAWAGMVPVGVKVSILKAAMAVALGETASVVPVGVAALAEGVIKAMTVTKLQWAAGVLAACGVLTAGGVWATGQGPGKGPPRPAPAVAGAPEKAAVWPAVAEEQADRQANSSQRQQSLNNLKQIMLAIHNYHDVHNHFPADIRDKDGKPLLSWRVSILPYLEQANLYKQLKLDEPWDSEHNLKLLATMPAVYRVGFELKESTHTYYQAFAGPGTPLHPRVGPGGMGRGVSPGPWYVVPAPSPADVPAITLAAITDGTSNTFCVVEAGPPVPWTKPADIPFDPAKPLKLVGPFSNVWHVAMMDGSAQALRRDIDAETLRRLIVMNDGQVVPQFNTLRAALSAETADEKAQLRKQLDENQQLIDQVEQLMREHSALLALRNAHTGDLMKAGDQHELLTRMAEELRVRNRMLRQDLGLRPGAPVPKPLDRDGK